MSISGLNTFDKAKSPELFRGIHSVMSRYQKAVEILFKSERWEAISAHEGVEIEESLQPSDEEIFSRGVILCANNAELSFFVGDPFLFVDPERACKAVMPGPTLTLNGNVSGREFSLILAYNMLKNRWTLTAGRDTLEPYACQPNSEFSKAEIRKSERAIARFNAGWERLDFPDIWWKESPLGGLELEVFLSKSKKRLIALAPTFYDICDAYFAYELIRQG